MIDLNNKKFIALQNSENGEVSQQTCFHYFQQGKMGFGQNMGAVKLRKAF